MTKQWRRFDRSLGLERALGTLERVVAEVRRAPGASPRGCFGVVMRGDHVDELFRKAVRGVDTLGELLDATSGVFSAPGELAGLAADLLAEHEPALHACGLRRGSEGGWEADYLALEYVLGQDPERVFRLFEAVARDHLRPHLIRAAVAA